MAEKEERIFITKIQPECKFRELHETTAGGHTWVDFMCGKSTIKKLECDEKCFEQCEWKELTGISRQESIERMAKGIHYYEWAHDKHFPKWNELNSDIQNDYKNMAEAALNALLGDK